MLIVSSEKKNKKSRKKNVEVRRDCANCKQESNALITLTGSLRKRIAM